MEKTRKEKRKEARLAKAAAKHTFRLKRQKDTKSFRGVKSNDVRASKVNTGRVVSELDDNDDEVGRKGVETEWEPSPSKDDDVVVGPPERGLKLVRTKKGLKKSKKTNFEKFLEMDQRNGTASANEDLEMERRLARKLKVKSGKLRGEDDELNEMFDGLSSILDSPGEDDELLVKKSRKISKKRKVENSLDNSIDEVSEPIADAYDSDEVSEEAPSKVLSKKKRKVSGERPECIAAENTTAKEVDVHSKAPQKYMAPHLRSRVEGTELEEHSQARRRLRGLLNRVSESNVESITGEVSAIFRSMPRNIGSQMICEEVLASCSSGPRGNEQYAAVFAAFVAGMACSVGVDFGAKLMASLAKNFEEEFHKKDNLSVRNLTLLFSYLYVFGVCSSDLVYDFITVLGQRLMEVDVSTILTVLQCCGIKIRADDPLSMKSFIVSVQSRVNELKASSGDDQSNINSKRMAFMLETILDIKNNKKRPKEDSAHHTRIKKWLQKLRVEGIIIRGLTWSKLLDPEKKGQWWSSTGDALIDNVEEVANTIDKEVIEAQKMLQLASGQRMNTEARKAIFCVVMSSEDYIDAFEKLLRLDLPGKQDREVMRVLLHCCLQEKVFNKYYVVLASKLCEHEKNHKFTLQYCLWDHFKEVESMELSRSLNLARFVAETIAAFTLSVAVLKVVDLNDIRQLTPKRMMHFRMLFEALFEYPDKVLWNVFTRVAVIPDLESLRQGIEFFIKEYVAKNNKTVRAKLKILKKALNNVEGILM